MNFKKCCSGEQKGAATQHLFSKKWHRKEKIEVPAPSSVSVICLLYLIIHWCDLVMCHTFNIFCICFCIGWWATLPQGVFYFLESNLLKDKVTSTACRLTGQNVSFQWSYYAGILRRWKPFRKLAIILSGRATLQPPQAPETILISLSSVSLLDYSFLGRWEQ